MAVLRLLLVVKHVMTHASYSVNTLLLSYSRFGHRRYYEYVGIVVEYHVW